MGLMKSLSPGNVPDDPWFRLLGACKKQAANAKTAFIHDVRVGHEPLCVMTTNRHVNDLRRFGYNPYGVSPSSREPPHLSTAPPGICTSSTIYLPGIRPPYRNLASGDLSPSNTRYVSKKKKIFTTTSAKFRKHLKKFQKHLSKNSCPALKNRVFRKT